MRSHIDACRAEEYKRAAGFLNFDSVREGTREVAAEKYARQLKIVLDRNIWIQYDLLSDRPEGHMGDGLPADLERLGTIGGFEVLLERVPGMGGAEVWKFSSSTVESIPILYSRHGFGRLGEILPAPLPEIDFLELRLWQWIGLLLLAALAAPASWIVTLIVYRVGRSIVGRTETKVDDRLLERLTGPFRLFAAVVLFAIGSYFLALSVPAYMKLKTFEVALLVVAFTWALLRCVDVVADIYIERFSAEGRKGLVSIVPLGGRIVKFAILAVALVALLQNIGFNVTGLVAGLGVGGLAVALAAQKSIANLFGGVSLVADQPVRVGDFCKFGDNRAGTVEEIGIRSTRVRTLDRTLVTIPNSDFSEFQLENFGARDRIRLLTVLTLRYETTPDQMRHVLTELRKLLVAHPMVDKEPARVRLINFGAFSLDVEVVAYVLTNEWAEFLKVKEDVYLRIMEIVEASGTGFAFPSQTLYLGRDGGLDAARAEEAEARVRAWREAGELPFPDLDPETLERIDGTLDYPPRGSATTRSNPSS